MFDAFFELVKSAYEKGGLTCDGIEEIAGRIFNCDESGLCTDPKGKKVFIAKGKKDAYIETPTSGKAMYTVLFCTSAAGEYMPPLTVYKALNLYEKWTQRGPKGATFACTPSGWMHDEAFENWFVCSFIPFVKDKEKPVFLFFDGHGSHLTYKTARSAMDEQIVLICIYTTTYQPCPTATDVSVYV